MSTRIFVAVYLTLLVTVAVLYMFAVGVSALAHGPTPEVDRAITVLSDLIKVIVGAAIGAISASFAIPANPLDE